MWRLTHLPVPARLPCTCSKPGASRTAGWTSTARGWARTRAMAPAPPGTACACPLCFAPQASPMAPADKGLPAPSNAIGPVQAHKAGLPTCRPLLHASRAERGIGMWRGSVQCVASQGCLQRTEMPRRPACGCLAACHLQHTHTHLCLQTLAHTRTHLCAHALAHTHLCLHTLARTHLCLHTLARTHVTTYSCTYTLVPTYTCTHTYTHTHTCAHIHSLSHTYTLVPTYSCTYTHLCAHALAHTHTHVRTYSCTHTLMLRTYSCTHTLLCAHTLAHAHTRTHWSRAFIGTPSQERTCASSIAPLPALVAPAAKRGKPSRRRKR